MISNIGNFSSSKIVRVSNQVALTPTTRVPIRQLLLQQIKMFNNPYQKMIPFYAELCFPTPNGYHFWGKDYPISSIKYRGTGATPLYGVAASVLESVFGICEGDAYCIDGGIPRKPLQGVYYDTKKDKIVGIHGDIEVSIIGSNIVEAAILLPRFLNKILADNTPISSQQTEILQLAAPERDHSLVASPLHMFTHPGNISGLSPDEIDQLVDASFSRAINNQHH